VPGPEDCAGLAVVDATADLVAVCGTGGRPADTRASQDTPVSSGGGRAGMMRWRTGRMADMEADQLLRWSGTPRTRCVYAVFDTAQEAGWAEQELQAQRAHPSRLHGPIDARALGGEGGRAKKIVGKLARAVQTFGGEDQETDRYAIHLRHGRTMLVVPDESYRAAEALTGTLTRHGGYDITYFDDWTIDQMAARVDAGRGVPPNDASAATDEHSSGDR